ncbi:MAG: VOC family protein [Pseudomonadota bacterium]
MARLEHVNINVPDGAEFCEMLSAVFGWKIRWEGPSTMGSGYFRHIGEADTYISVVQPEGDAPKGGAFNHLGVVVDDLDSTAEKVRAQGLKPHHFADYEPGRRFYFYAENGIEIEVVQYD